MESKKITKSWNLLKCLKYVRIKKCEYLYFSSTLFNTLQDDGKYLNILDDYYFSIFPKNSYVYEDLDRFYACRHPKVNKHFSVISSYIELFAKFLSKIKTNKVNDDLLQFAKLFNDNISLDLLKSEDHFISVYAFLIRKFLKYTSPKLLVINSGCYGYRRSVVIYEAKKLGIKVAEIQHGILDDKVYKLSKYDSNENNLEIFTMCLPDYLFLFGDYWKDYLNIPGVIPITMGHPHLNNIKKQLAKNKNENKTFLFVSSPIFNDKLFEVARYLRESGTRCNIVFRFHPKDAYLIYTPYADRFKQYDIKLSTIYVRDLYDDIADADFLVGSYSFSLFEAMAFNKKIFVLLDDIVFKYFPSNVVTTFETGADILNKINGFDDACEVNIENFWAPDFYKNFQLFVQQYH
ncbi:MAG: hypothetical protein PHY08_13520 [Candidatus Cloacimonetes bacterium]|nr:hypothetical protein [Candidatus Cloacimonadota bacterium]